MWVSADPTIKQMKRARATSGWEAPFLLFTVVGVNEFAQSHDGAE